MPQHNILAASSNPELNHSLHIAPYTIYIVFPINTIFHPFTIPVLLISCNCCLPLHVYIHFLLYLLRMALDRLPDCDNGGPCLLDVCIAAHNFYQEEVTTQGTQLGNRQRVLSPNRNCLNKNLCGRIVRKYFNESYRFINIEDNF